MDATEQLSDATDFQSLSKILLAVCERFGALHSFHLVHNKRARRVSCCIELDSQKQHRALANTLGGKIYGEIVCVEIPVNSSFAGPDDKAAESGARPQIPIIPWRATQQRTLGKGPA